MAKTATSTAPQELPVAIGIGRKERAKLSQLLERALANTYVLYAKIQGFHWNASGPMFFALHKMTEEQYEDLAQSVDQLAERIRAIGFRTPTTLAHFVRIADIAETPEDPDATTMAEILAKDHETVAASFRDAVEEADNVRDMFTADLLTGRIGKHEHFAWMLRAQGAH